MLFKRQRYANKKILAAAKDENCTMESPNCNHNPETTVFCHGNESFAGKGISQKADDCFGFFGCSGCHAWYDGNEAEYSERVFYFLRAYYRTVRRLLDKGVIK